MLAPEAPASASASAAPHLALLGQALQSYIVASAEGGMLLIDQHAAHERVLYEALERQIESGALDSREPQAPLTVELEQQAHQHLIGQRDWLAALGFAVDDFGMALRVRSLPRVLPEERCAAALADLAALPANDATRRPGALALLAHHAALRPGQPLTHERMQALLDDLAGCASAGICPHGRPTAVTLAGAQIEQLFGRAR
jgi:DNA mismatch repair protein MutL